MKKAGKIIVATALFVVCVGVAVVYYSGLSRITLLGFVLNTFLSRNNPLGTLTVESRRTGTSASNLVPALAATPDPALVSSDQGDWPSYNRTFTSERYSPLLQVNTKNVDRLEEICRFDTHLRENYESGPIVVNGALIFTSALDTFSIDPASCRLNWQAHENYRPLSPNLVNRGAAYLDGRLFRGTLDGRVIAYDFNTGKRLWATEIGDPSKELVDAALIAWDGLVFAGIAQGDTKGVRGRVYGLSASDGHIVWETYVVPPVAGNSPRGPQGSMPALQKESWKNAPGVPISGGGTWTSYTLDISTAELYIPVGNSSPDFVESLRAGENLFTNSVLVLDAHNGNYSSHYRVIPRDWHDWDVSNTPALITTRAGRKLLTLAPKDGFLYAYDRGTKELIYRNPVTRIEHPDVPLNSQRETHFCPGAVGGAEWNGVAFDPHSNLIFTGEDEWCTAVKLKTEAQVKAIEEGAYWMGADTPNPMAVMGTQDPHSKWAGWLYATDADSGEWVWRLKSNYPILSGVTPTAGGLVFFGDMGGNFYAADIASGKPVWKSKVDGAIGGGVITYIAEGKQRLAVAAGMSSVVWPTEQHTAKIVIFALPDPTSP
jgi:alcohol dehydrogenase (cytochrome c)